MSVKKVMLTMLLVVLSAAAFAQSSDFCDAVTAILHDAPNRFKNIRGKMVKSDYNVTSWQSGIAVPGSIGARFVASMGLFYEAAFFQSPAITQLPAYYEKVKQELSKCLTAQGYTMTLSDNFSPGLSAYKKAVFMIEPKEDTPPGAAPAHVTLEALYNKDIKKYTVVMYIFEN